MIRYAGVHPLLPSPEVEAFLNANLPMEMARYFTAPGHGPELYGSGPTVPVKTWQPMFQPRVNTLYWPTGASRWAVMLLLVDSDMMDTIRGVTSPSSSTHWEATGAQLQIADTQFVGTIANNAWTLADDIDPEEAPPGYRRTVALSTEMFALRPHPVSVTGSQKSLWLLPLVDERWFWQWKHIPVKTGPQLVSRDAALGEISDYLGIADFLDTDPESEYPDLLLYPSDSYANAAQFMDALAQMYGQRFIRDIDKKCRTYTHNGADDIWSGNLDSVDADDPRYGWQRLAGGEFTYRGAASLPERVVVCGVVNKVVSAEDVGATDYKLGTDFPIFARYPETATTNTLQTNFANRVATDWYGWRRKRHADMSFIGVKAWDMTGFEDYVSVSHGTPHEAPATRVVTLPENMSHNPVPKPLETCAEYFQVWTGMGNITGDFDWQVVRLSDDTVVATGNFVLGTTTAADLKSEIQTDIGGGYTCVVVGGELPGNTISIHLNRGLSFSKYKFEKTADNLTPENPGQWAFVQVSACCVIGG